ncbi:D-aminopeptidase [Acidisoma sp. C75]
MPNPDLDRLIADLPRRYPGPGGAIAVLREGTVLARHAWGFADTARRIPFTPATMSLICSISKQFTCALLLDLFADPAELQPDLDRRLPLLQGEKPGIRDLMHNQSGLRDYWAVAMLHGAPVEGRFTDADAERIVSRTSSLHFAPGTRYSYCNQNFRLLSELIEGRTGERFGDLLRRRLFDRVGMPQAALNADTAAVPGGTLGYEGSLAAGFRPAVNRIVWTGDAGIAASLEDMIAWERWIDATRDDPAALYSRLAAPVTFRGGAPAAYGFGLARASFHGHAATCHEGGLRGFRSFRVYLPKARLSVVTLFNHMANPRGPAEDILALLLGGEPRPEPATGADPAAFAGRYIEPESGLAVEIAPEGEGKLRLGYGHGPDRLAPAAEGGYRSAAGTRLMAGPDGLTLEKPQENLRSLLQPVAAAPAAGGAVADIEGLYRSDELGAELRCMMAGGVLHAAFQGFLGQGEMQPLLPFAQDIWLIPCPRALDYSAPGDWTFRIRRDAAGRVVGATLGCWLARGLAYARV